MRSIVSDVSRTIRDAVLPHGLTIHEVPDDVLRDLAETLTLFQAAVAVELQRREAADAS